MRGKIDGMYENGPIKSEWWSMVDWTNDCSWFWLLVKSDLGPEEMRPERRSVTGALWCHRLTMSHRRGDSRHRQRPSLSIATESNLEFRLCQLFNTWRLITAVSGHRNAWPPPPPPPSNSPSLFLLFFFSSFLLSSLSCCCCRCCCCCHIEIDRSYYSIFFCRGQEILRDSFIYPSSLSEQIKTQQQLCSIGGA